MRNLKKSSALAVPALITSMFFTPVQADENIPSAFRPDKIPNSLKMEVCDARNSSNIMVLNQTIPSEIPVAVRQRLYAIFEKEAPVIMEVFKDATSKPDPEPGEQESDNLLRVLGTLTSAFDLSQRVNNVLSALNEQNRESIAEILKALPENTLAGKTQDIGQINIRQIIVVTNGCQNKHTLTMAPATHQSPENS